MSSPVTRGLRMLARAVLPYAVVVVRRLLDCLYILQLERYNPSRYAGWLRAHRRLVLDDVEIGTQLLLAIAAALGRRAPACGADACTCARPRGVVDG